MSEFGFRILTKGYTLGMRVAAHGYSWWARRAGWWPEESAKERWGKSFPASHSAGPVWIHAASVGEARVAGQFANELATHGCSVIASSMTETGYNLSREVYPTGTTCFRLPLDLPGPLTRALNHFRPSALVLVETEWWPNLLLESSRAGLRIFVVNGRISERALRRYQLGASFWRRLLGTVECFYMRSQQDADRLRELGVDDQRIKVAGSLKAMIALSTLISPSVPVSLRAREDSPIWIAGCTRPGEEEVVLAAFATLSQRLPNLRLWLAPRHPERFNAVARLVERRGSKVVRWSECETNSRQDVPSDAVILIDRMGGLAPLYLYATVAFIGGSLKPYGGHNPLEPALAGAPVVFGPYMEDQQDAAADLLSLGFATQVTDAASLSAAIAESLRHPRTVSERAASVETVVKRYSHVRAEVARDLCARLGVQRSVSTPCPVCTAARFLHSAFMGWTEGRRSPGLLCFGAIAKPLSWIYRAGAALDARLRKPAVGGTSSRIRIVVISSPLVGGVGKSPLVAHLVSALLDSGHAAHIVTTGYKRQSHHDVSIEPGKASISAGTAGDEAVMLAQMTGAVVYVGEDLTATVARVARGLAPEFIIVDDGVRRRWQGERRIVVLAASDLDRPVRFLPDGRWRIAPKRAWPAAGVAIIQVGQGTSAAISTEVQHQHARTLNSWGYVGPIGWYTSLVEGVVPLTKGESGASDTPPSGAPFLFCGIGLPARFERQVEFLGISAVGRQRFPDHHAYSPADMSDLEHQCRQAGAAWMLTTHKDAVKIDPAWTLTIPVFWLRIRLELAAGTDMLSVLQEQTL
ncbi:MAG: tetraacyldisaccharide 4'-kinase [candidate division Zixibacteria bacterium]|nr:tetraacyldisaccharide 4'-kinase [candidate division Zixibacteria bacterium]